MIQTMKEPKPKLGADLRHWKLHFDHNGKPRLIGQVYGHASGRFAPGDQVMTSELLKIDFVTMLAETRNTIYSLGTPA